MQPAKWHLLDSILFIYWLEDNPQYAKRVHAIYTSMQKRHDQLLTGAFTFGEVLAGVYRQGASDRASDLRRQLQGIVSEIVPLRLSTMPFSEREAALRQADRFFQRQILR